MKYQTLMHWKFRKLHQALESTSIAHTAGYLELLWLHCQQVGNGPVLKADDVEAICDWQGEPRKLLRCLREFTWLDDCAEENFVEVHDFSDHAPGYVKKREDRAAYMRNYRKDKRPKQEQVKPPLRNVTNRNELQTPVTDPTLPNLTLPIESTNVLSSEQPPSKPVQTKIKGTQRMSFRDRAAACGYWEFHNAYPDNRRVAPERVLPAFEAAIKDTPDETRYQIMAYLNAMIANGEYTKNSGKYCPGMVKFLEEKHWLRKPVRQTNKIVEAPEDPDDDNFGTVIVC